MGRMRLFPTTTQSSAHVSDDVLTLSFDFFLRNTSCRFRYFLICRVKTREFESVRCGRISNLRVGTVWVESMLHRVVEDNRCSLVCHAFLGSSHLKHYVFFIFTFFHEQPELSCVGSGKIYPTPNKMSELPQLLLPQTTLELQKLRSASDNTRTPKTPFCLDSRLQC